MALRESTDGPTAESVANALSQLFILADTQGDREAALRYAERAVSVAESSGNPIALIQPLALLGRTAHLQGDTETARRHYERAYAIWREHGDDDDYRVTALLPILRFWKRQAGNFVRAEELHRAGLRIAERFHGPEHTELISHLLGLGQVNKSLGRLDEARSYLTRALQISDRTVGLDSVFAGYLYNALGTVEEQAGDPESAEGHYRSSIRVWSGIAEDHPNLALNRANIGKILLERGAYAESIPLLSPRMR